MTTRLRAQPLPPGGTIGVFAPAEPYHNRSDVLRGVAWWEGHGKHLFTTPFGVRATLDGDAGSLVLEEPALAVP